MRSSSLLTQMKWPRLRPLLQGSTSAEPKCWLKPLLLRWKSLKVKSWVYSGFLLMTAGHLAAMSARAALSNSAMRRLVMRFLAMRTVMLILVSEI